MLVLQRPHHPLESARIAAGEFLHAGAHVAGMVNTAINPGWWLPFSFRPRDTQERARAEIERHPLRAASDGIRILVVEDESIVALDLISTLKKMGHSIVAHALCGEDAIRLAAETKPTLVMMDIRLQGEMDGIEAAGRIRASLGTPVIFLTAFVDDATRGRAMKTNPVGFLRKPFSKYELEDALITAMESTQK
jgi:CheY-like chemotaxis protein